MSKISRRSWRGLGWHVLLSALAFSMALPFVYLCKLSIQPDRDVLHLPIKLIPSGIELRNFQRAAAKIPLTAQLVNTLIYAATTSVLTVVTGVMAAYTLAKLRLPGARWLLLLFIATILLPPGTRAIPLYTLMAQLHWVNTWQGLIVPMAWSGFAIFFLHQYLLTLPDELLEAARMDGASEGQIFRRMILPLAKPALVTTLLAHFLLRWNDVIWPLLITKGRVTTLPVGFATLRQTDLLVQWNVIAAALMWSFLPSLLLFGLLRKHLLNAVEMTVK